MAGKKVKILQFQTEEFTTLLFWTTSGKAKRIFHDIGDKITIASRKFVWDLMRVFMCVMKMP